MSNRPCLSFLEIKDMNYLTAKEQWQIIIGGIFGAFGFFAFVTAIFFIADYFAC